MTAQNIFTSAKAKGFTLIELLVVIGILGILATALIATIDPFEQIRKANDSNTKNVMVEYLNGNLRYYTTHSAMPWAAVAEGGFDGCGDNNGAVDGPTLTEATGAECVDALIADGELKSTFTDATGILAEITINGTENTLVACYMPISKSGQNDPNTKYDATGDDTDAASCNSQITNDSESTNCYYCSSQ